VGAVGKMSFTCLDGGAAGEVRRGSTGGAKCPAMHLFFGVQGKVVLYGWAGGGRGGFAEEEPSGVGGGEGGGWRGEAFAFAWKTAGH